MDRWFRNVVGFCATVVVVSAFGCGAAGEANHGDASREQKTNRVEANEEVTVLRREGDRTLVRTNHGATGYLPTDRLHAGVVTVASELKPAEESAPRTRTEIRRTRGQVKVLYLTADGSQELMRPHCGAVFFDRDRSQIYWQAFTCIAKGCSGVEDVAGRNVFPGVMKGFEVDSDGKLLSRGDLTTLVCPACGTREGLKRYRSPETAAEFDELTAEHSRRLRWMRMNKSWLKKNE